MERVVHDNKWLLFAGRQAFRSFVRAYATHSMDTKGIFAVQSLHLGHVAKSFGLRESPKALRSSEDVIGKIFNGAYSVLNARSNENKRDRFKAGGSAGGGKGSAGKGAGGSGKGARSTTVRREDGAGGDRKRKSSGDAEGDSPAKRSRGGGASNGSSSSTQNPGVAVKSGKDRQKLRKMGPGSAGAAGGKNRSSSKGRGDKLTASGVFRKTTGYFKKKLRSQMSSEFSK